MENPKTDNRYSVESSKGWFGSRAVNLGGAQRRRSEGAGVL